jgi:hypothetical protein
VLKQELSRDQIVRIAMVQSGSGDKTALRCALLYKEKSAEQDSVPIADLKFKIYPTKKAWPTTVAAAAADIAQDDKRVVELVHYPRNFGGDRQQVLFYTPKAASKAEG